MYTNQLEESDLSYICLLLPSVAQRHVDGGVVFMSWFKSTLNILRTHRPVLDLEQRSFTLLPFHLQIY